MYRIRSICRYRHRVSKTEDIIDSWPADPSTNRNDDVDTAVNFGVTYRLK